MTARNVPWRPAPTVSILGDSISTYEGLMPPGFAVWYAGDILRMNGLTSPRDLWWSQVIDALGGTLCANDSYSGSLVTGTSFPSACSPRRIEALRSATGDPDLVLVYLGINDFGYGTPDRMSYPPVPTNPMIFYDAYALMIERARRRCPHTTFVCATLLKSAVSGGQLWDLDAPNVSGMTLERTNDSIRRAALAEGAIVADLAAGGERYASLDGIHPTKEGHATLARQWLRALGVR